MPSIQKALFALILFSYFSLSLQYICIDSYDGRPALNGVDGLWAMEGLFWEFWRWWGKGKGKGWAAHCRWKMASAFFLFSALSFFLFEMGYNTLFAHV